MIAKKNKKDMKNYIIYAVIVIATLILVLYLRGCYKTYREHQLTIPIIQEYVSEVKYEELNNYIMENPDFILYTCTSYDQICRDFEKKFKDVVLDHNLKDKIVYLNLNSIVEEKVSYQTFTQEDFVEAAIDGYSDYFETYPKVAVFKDSELVEFIAIDNSDEIDNVVQLLEEYEIIGEE